MADGRLWIDGLRGPEGGFDRAGLESILPYGPDFLFVDEVVSLTPSDVEGRFRVPERASYLGSHFVDLPIMPGVLIAEGLAQAASLIVRYNLPSPEQKHVLGLEVERARFQSPARPGELLTYRARLGAMNRRTARLEGDTHVGDRIVCRAKLTVAIVDRRWLRQTLGLDTEGRRSE